MDDSKIHINKAMDETQSRHERAVGDEFIRWFNRRNGTKFGYDSRPHEAPDLRYVDGTETLNIEVTDAYCDARDAEMQWKTARKEANASDRWSGKNPDSNLVANINAGIARKCANAYGEDCVLVVAVRPGLTSAEEMEQLLSEIKIPKKSPFADVYLMGDFPWAESSRGGVRSWRLG